MKLVPRYYQKDAFEAFFKYTSENWGKNPVLVLPTGSGKSFIQALIVEKMLSWPNTSMLLLSHQKKLLEQNANEIYNYLDGNVDIGVYSAGMKSRQHKNRVTVAGIQSAYKKAWTHIGFRDLIIIDECHLLNSDNTGMYRSFITEMKKINPNVIILGLTATHFRTKTGLLTEGKNKLFDDIAYEVTIKELTNPDDYRNIDNKQYLCNLISPKKAPKSKVDLSNVHIRAGDYAKNEMESAYLKDDLVCRTVKEIKELAEGRKKALVFCAGIKHAEEVCQKMNDQGLTARLVHSKQKDEINEKNIQDFKDGKYRFLCNMGILTTGFDEKSIDCIVLLRATRSPGLLIQMCGRGLRIHLDKENCLILDFGENLIRFGPIDKIEVRKKPDGTGEIHTAPQKECPNCHSLLHLSVMECLDCGYIFPQKDKHEDKASEANVISEWKKPEELKVSEITYSRHSKKGKPDSLKVSYHIGMIEKYSSWICLEHEGFAKQKARQWVNNVTNLEINTVEEALNACQEFREPSSIIVDTNEKFPNITGYIFEEKELETKEEKKDYIIEETIKNEDIERLLF